MFGFLNRAEGHPTVQLEAQLGGQVKFYYRRALAAGKTVECTAVLPDGRKLDVAMAISQVLGKGHYTGTISAPSEAATSAAEFFAERAHQLYFKLADEPTHHLRSYVVRSPQLPNFRAITRDISLIETHLIVDGEMKIGARANLSLEVDDQQTPTLELKGDVMSCEPRPGGTFVIGFRFTETAPRSQQVLGRFLKRLKGEPS